MPAAVSVRPLASHPELKPVLAAWFVSEWPDWYGPHGPGDITADINLFAASDTRLPLAMVLFEGAQPVGAGALKAQSIASHHHLGPWAAAGYVQPACRGRGLGALLLQALVAQARALGFPQLYCGTSTAGRLLQRAGWTTVDVTVHEGVALTVFQVRTEPGPVPGLPERV